MTATTESTDLIGKPIPRIEDERFLRGEASYTADITLPNQSYLYVFRSPVAHADILRLDLSGAKSAPGVIGIIGPDDIRQAGIGTFSNRIRYASPSGQPMFEPPRTLVAQRRVRYAGEPIAAIIAETLDAARNAAELIDAEFNELPALPTLHAALAAGTNEIWHETPGNIAFELQLGDRRAVDDAFSRAAHVSHLDFVISRVSANPMEPRAAVAVHDPRRDVTTLHTTTQTPHSLRTEFAEQIFRIPTARLRIVAPDVGGAFGMKGSDYPEYGLCILAARILRRPVKWVADRSESFLSDHHARDNLWSVELALDAEHRFIALRSHSRANLGAYLAYAGTHQATNNVGGIAGVYRTPHIAVRIQGVHTNTQPVAPYRGAGRPEATFAIERIIEVAARELDIDSLELRRRNLIAPEEMPFKTGLVFEYDCGDFPAQVDRLMLDGDWQGFADRRFASEEAGLRRGRGVALAIEIACGPSSAPFEEYASVTIDPGGSAFLRVGTHSQGQGHETAFRQLAGARLGLAMQSIDIIFGDTDAVPHGKGTFGSRSLGAAGTALIRCFDIIISRARLIAAWTFECSPQDVTFDAGVFRVAGTDRSLDLKTIAKLAYTPGKIPPDAEVGLHASLTCRPDGATFPNSAHLCEVELDPDTGVVRVDRYLVVDDVGKVVNPLLVKGQIHGGVAQGLGQALSEAIFFDQHGQLISGSFQDYGMPRAGDLPMIEVVSHGVPTTMNPLGAKGAGEAGAVGSLAAITNAVCDALSDLGVRHIDPPITSEKVWRIIQKAKEETSRMY